MGGQDTPFSVLSQSRFDEHGRAIGFCIKWEKETKSENGPTIVSGAENFEIKTVQGGDSWAWPKFHTERKNSFE